MGIIILNVVRTFALVVTVLALGLAIHYYVRLRLMAHSAVIIEPGKGMWVECETPQFAATIEDVTLSGIVVDAGRERRKGMPCAVIGVTATGSQRYVMPFRTVLGMRVGERRVWSNPFST